MEDQHKQLALSLIAYAAQRDIPPDELCRNAHIDLRAIKKKEKYPITKRQFDDLWFYASKLTKDPLFGLHFGESLQLSALGVVGEIIKSSSTVGEGITIAASLTSVVTDLFRMDVTQTKRKFVIQLIPAIRHDSYFTTRQMTDLLMVFIIHELDGLLFEKIKPLAVCFPYVINDQAEYERVLRCKPSKSRNQLSIHFDGKFWQEPILSASYELHTFLLQKVNAYSSRDKTETFTDRIYHYLMTNAYLGTLSLEDVASNFNVTTRSVQRRLQDEGATFQQLSDTVRKSLALHYMEAGKHPVKEIAIMLGYNELSAFSRAFKRWTGKAPTNYLS